MHNDFKKGFAPSGGGSVVPEEHIEALDEEKLGIQAVPVRKPRPRLPKLPSRPHRRGGSNPHGCHTAKVARAHPLCRVDQEDHQGSGDDRLVTIARATARLEQVRPYTFALLKMLTDWPRSGAGSSAARRAGRAQAGRCSVVAADGGLAVRTTPTCFGAARSCSRCCARKARPRSLLVGRKALNYFTFRNWDISESWTGFSDHRQPSGRLTIASTLVDAFMVGAGDEGEVPGADGVLGVDELHIVATRFESMVSQPVEVVQIAPMVTEVVEESGPRTLYSFEPDATTFSRRCCRVTSPGACTWPCWKRRHRSRRRASAR